MAPFSHSPAQLPAQKLRCALGGVAGFLLPAVGQTLIHAPAASYTKFRVLLIPGRCHSRQDGAGVRDQKWMQAGMNRQLQCEWNMDGLWPAARADHSQFAALRPGGAGAAYPVSRS